MLGINESGFTQFLRKLGFSPTGNEAGRFVYSVEINQNQKVEIEFVYAPGNANFETKIYEEHSRIWNSNSASAFILVSENESFVINPKVKPDESSTLRGKIESFEAGINTEIDHKTLEWLSCQQINAGYFFEFVHEKIKRNREQEVDKDLLLNLIALRLDLTSEDGSQTVADLLILRCLFLKYLEDRGIYPLGYVSGVLSDGLPTALLGAFDAVGRINGDIFKNEPLSEADFSRDQMLYLYRFFTSDYRSGQGTLFPYQFQYIPIQLISHVYEAFLSDSKRHGKGIYYTPQFIVRFMLEETLSPVLAKNMGVSVLDPACGSGAFLVESFRKIVQTKQVEKDFEAKKAILVHQIFGIDNDAEALRIATFSLYLALLEDLDAEFIRQQIEDNAPILPSLIGKNLLHGNTLTDDHLFEDKVFGCIVGNPPWGSVPEDDEPEHKNERRAIGSKGIAGGKPEYQSVSTFQRSQAFIFRVSKWLDTDALAGLIVNNSNFLNENALLFRRSLLEKYRLISFYELSHLNPILFKKKAIGIVNGEKIEVGATEPAVFLVFSNAILTGNKTRYIAPRLTVLSKHLNLVHFTQRDVRHVPQSVLIENDLAWKVLVNGNWEDLTLIRQKMNEWNPKIEIQCKVGFEAKIDMEMIGEPDFRPMIKSADFDSFYIKSPLSLFNWNQTLRRKPEPFLFEGNRILVAVRPKPEDRLRLRCVRIRGNEVFTVEAFGIFLKKDNKPVANLAPYLGIFNSSFGGYFSYLIATQWGKGDLKRAKLRTKEIEAFPIPAFPENDSRMLQLTEAVLEMERRKRDPFDHQIEGLQKQIDELVFDLYELLDFEKETVREFYDVNVLRKNDQATEQDLADYALKFKSVFELVLAEHLEMHCEYKVSSQFGAFICFKIGGKGSNSSTIKRSRLEDEAVFHVIKQAQLVEAFSSNRLNELPTRIYTPECFFLVKSHFFKDWTIRQAIEDANEEVKTMLQETQTTE